MKNGFITEYLSTLAGMQLVYGENDCHVMCLTVIDMITGSKYRDEIYHKYTTATAGRKYAKENCSFPTLSGLCRAKGELVNEPLDGDIIIASGHCTVFWRGKVVVLTMSLPITARWKKKKYTDSQGVVSNGSCSTGRGPYRWGVSCGSGLCGRSEYISNHCYRTGFSSPQLHLIITDDEHRTIWGFISQYK